MKRIALSVLILSLISLPAIAEPFSSGKTGEMPSSGKGVRVPTKGPAKQPEKQAKPVTPKPPVKKGSKAVSPAPSPSSPS